MVVVDLNHIYKKYEEMINIQLMDYTSVNDFWFYQDKEFIVLLGHLVVVSQLLFKNGAGLEDISKSTLQKLTIK